MLPNSVTSKGLVFVVALVFCLLFFYNAIEDKRGESAFAFNITRNVVRLEQIHSPLLKSLLKTGSSSSNGGVGRVRVSSNRSVAVDYKNSSSTTTTALLYYSSSSSTISSTSSVEAATVEAGNATDGVVVCSENPPNLGTSVKVSKYPVPSIYQLEHRFSWLQPGGHWAPDDCKVLKRVALIVPFRCRAEHLLLFLQHMHPFLRKQQIDYTIFIVEQDGSGPFNRASLMNVGFKEALKIAPFDCFIFHDIDLLPEDERNLYTCPEYPRHMSVAIDSFQYKLPYTTIFGGVSAITREHFELLNGFSNSFWGWGGEDDDMANRLKHHNLFISRYPIAIARYTMLTHKKEKPNPNRYETLKTGKIKYDSDGLSNLQYEVKKMKRNLLYTWLLVEIGPRS